MAATALVGMAALRAVRPLVSPEDDRTAMVGQRTRAALEREKMLTLRAIKELEFDRAMGKLSDDDFREMSRPSARPRRAADAAARRRRPAIASRSSATSRSGSASAGDNARAAPACATLRRRARRRTTATRDSARVRAAAVTTA